MPRARPPSSPSLAAATAAAATSSTSTILNHTFAPFYACYLLKSYNSKRLNQTYIGSTPDPPRRWRQHMGETVGGAFKTRLARPWEMEAIVYGFPTKLQALQFEWAWQNPHASRLIHAVPAAGAGASAASNEATSLAAGGEGSDSDAGTTTTKGRKKKGATTTKVKVPKPPKPVAQFPRTAASNRGQTRIQVLQYMLTVPPWRSFNLRVMLFSELAQQWWDRARAGGPQVRSDAGWRKFEKELEKQKGKGREDKEGVGDAWGERKRWIEKVRVDVRLEGVDGERLVRTGERKEEDGIGRMRIDDDDFFQEQWSKWTELVSSRDCHLCSQAVDHEDHLSFFLCTAASSVASSSKTTLNPCTALFHPACLSSHFLSSQSAAAAPTTTAAPAAVLAPPLLPTHGACPACAAELHWTDLVRGSYRRMEEVEGKRKKRTRQRGLKAGIGSEAALAEVDEEEEEEEEEEEDDLSVDDDDGSLPSTPKKKKQKKRATSKSTTTPAAAKGRGRKTVKMSSSSSAKLGVQLGETFDFSSDPGPEDDPAAFDMSDEGTDDEPGDEERSFARLEAAQDALDFAELVEDEEGPLFREEERDEDDIRRGAVVEGYEDDGVDWRATAAALGKKRGGAKKQGRTASPRKKTATTKTQRRRSGATATAISTVTKSFTTTKPARSRSSTAKKPAASIRTPSFDDESDGLSPLGPVKNKRGGEDKEVGGGRKAAKVKKKTAAYIEISD
ncbi:hypothetical protein JCM10908_003434 [Rhodotorula pacifica]|uniref:endonuclease n=1 Tax=Rhodotorula pacifica TaxID=1495444 RepID=UPI0031785260